MTGAVSVTAGTVISAALTIVVAGPWNAKTATDAASKNAFSCLKFAVKNGCPVDHFTYYCAAMSGSIQCLQFLLENSTYVPNVSLPITCTDNIEAIKFAQEKGLITWSELVCQTASSFGSVNALKYARAQQCPWSAKTADTAGNLACLQYALQNVCPYTEYVCANAVKKGDLAMLQYAVEFGCTWDLNTLCLHAPVNDLEMVRYIYNKSRPHWPKGLRSTDPEVLAFMHEHQCTFRDLVE